MVTLKSRQGLVRSSFILLLILSIITTTLLQFRHPTSWKYFYETKQTFARKVGDSNETTPYLPKVEASLRATLHSDKLKSSMPAYSQLQTSAVGSTETAAQVDSDKERGSVQDNESDFLITSSPQQKDALFRPWDRLEADKPFWQSVDDAMDVLMYSAHYDDVEKSPVVRVIGVARDPLPYSNVTCRYYGCLRCPVMHSLPSSLVFFRNRNGRRYIGAWVLCPLPAHGEVLPFALSVHKEEQNAGTRPVLIHYSNTTHSRMSIRVQHLLKQRNIVLKEGDIDTFSAVWKYVRNEEFNQDLEDLGSKLPSGFQGDTSGVNFEDENGKQLPVTSKTSQAEEVEKKKNETGTIAAQNYKDKIVMNNSGDENISNNSLPVTNTLNNDEKANTKTLSKDIHSDPHRNNTLDKYQPLATDRLLISGHQAIPEGYRWNVTRCFPAFQRKFNNHVMLAEMVAASRALGVDHFVFYVESVSPMVNITLQVLQSRGFAEVLPWNMHMGERDLFYKGQFSAIQDCLYRHLRSSRYVLTGDVDELFVPKTSWSLVPLLDHWFGKKPNCGSFQFLNSFCNVHLPPVQPSQVLGKPPTHNITNTISNETITNGTLTSNSDNNHNNKNSKNTTTTTTTTNAFTDSHNNSDQNKKTSNNTINTFTDINNNNKHIYNNFHNSNIIDIDPTTFSMAMQYKLPIFLHSLRHVQIMKPGQRSKIALDPRKVLVGSVHLVDKLRKGFRSCVMNEREGLLHHYRGLFGTEKVLVVEDNSVRMHGATYVKEAVAILKEVEKIEKMERDRESG